MKIDNKEYDHIEILDETGLLVAMISDQQIVQGKNSTVNLCETSDMFKKNDDEEKPYTKEL